jgi:hypothetical protein
VPVKVFDRITAIREPNQKAHTMPTARNQFPSEVNSLLASAGIAPGGKIPLKVLDAALKELNYGIAKRLETKSLFAKFGIIEL